MIGRPSINLTGQKFGRLTAVSAVAGRDRHGKIRWLCRCDCGNETIVVTGSLRAGNTQSCGCWQRQVKLSRLNKHRKHGLHGKPEWRAWANMRKRCLNQSDRAFPSYGGRGITVCDRWLSSFENFIADMGFKPSSAHSIDRIDNDGPYSPENCRWATKREQVLNRRPRSEWRRVA